MKRPFYVVAHRINDVDGISQAIALGANAIECDVRENTVAHDAYFGPSTRLDAWLEAAAVAAQQFQQLALIYFDIKEPSHVLSIAQRAQARLPPDLSLLFSISEFSDRDYLHQIIDTLDHNEGVTIDEHRDPFTVADFFRSHAVEQCWYSFGMSSRHEESHARAVMPAIREAIRLRDTNRAFRKVVVWTLSRHDLMEQYITMGVDGILVEVDSLRTLGELVATSDTVQVATRADRAF